MNIMTNNDFLKELVSRVIKEGAAHAAVIGVAEIELDPAFRGMCESNVCGNFGKCWMCPPDVGTIEELMEQLRGYNYALVYQTIGELADSYDFEGMMEAGWQHNQLTSRLTRLFQADADAFSAVLHLGAGGCRLCPVCAKKDNLPCRHPEEALSSLEAYGVNVSRLAAACEMNYINGKDTVTYFGAVFFVLKE